MVLTGDEEENMGGTREVVDKLHKVGIEPYVIVLDVTNVGYDAGYDFTIENNFFRKHPVREGIFKVAEESNYNYAFVSSHGNKVPKFIEEQYSHRIEMTKNGKYKEALADESWEYDEQDVFVFSLCLPIGDFQNEHNDLGVYIRKDSFRRYSEMISRVANAIEAYFAK